MIESSLLHELIACSADRQPQAPALTDAGLTQSYASLQQGVQQFAAALVGAGVQRGDRVAIYLDKRSETVVASFGAAAAGAVFVPVNPLLKPDQVSFILADCDARVLVTSAERLGRLAPELARCAPLRLVVVTGAALPDLAAGVPAVAWNDFMAAPMRPGHRVIDTDLVAILYTSGSTGRPKGVVLSHRNMVAGAKSVASYLGNHSHDTLLAALPLSFDAGFSQLTTAFHAGARVVLLNYLLPRDVLKALARAKRSPA